MFRPTKRPKKKKVVTTSTSSGDDKDGASSSEDEIVVVKRPVQKSKKSGRKKAKVPSKISFELDTEEPTKKKKRKGGGMGYGGAQITVEAEEETVEAVESDMYGKEAMEKLKSQQRFKKKKIEKKNEAEEQRTETRDVEADGGTSLPSYIPLSTAKETEPVILAGEEAINFDQNESHEQMELEPQQTFPATDDCNAEAQDWEAQVARRAGILPSKAIPNTNGDASNKLSQLKQQVESTLGHLRNQQDDIKQAHDVRMVELQQTRSELQRHEQELDKSSKALEYYQQLRLTLASWVGALRELQSKVQPVQQALLELETEISSPQHLQEWQADVIATLSEAQLLDRVLGKQVEIPAREVATQVDEFGRDVKSQQSLQREQRARQRRQSRQEWEKQQTDESLSLEDYYSSNGFSSNEEKDQEERRTALLEALHVAKQELSEDYTSTSSLFGVFEEWRQHYPDEYKQCFASLSFADLLGVLVRVEMCSDLNPLHFGEKQHPQLDWLEMLKSSDSDQDESEDASPLQQVIDKILVAAVVKILELGAYNLYSTSQTAISSFCRWVFGIMPHSRSVTRLRVRLVQYIRECLDSVSIPILVASSDVAAKAAQIDFLDQAMEFATEGQVYRLKNLLVNIFRYWAPIVKENDEALCQTVLEFVSNNFLFTLSSLQARGLTNLSTKVFGEVWEASKESKWLDRPTTMLQAAPLRAAAVAFQQS